MPAVPIQSTNREQEEVDALARVAHSREYSQGAEVEAFEEEFAAYVGTRYAVAVGSGGAALQFALQARGVGPADEVVTSPLASAAVFRAIHAAGAVAVVASIDERTYTLDPESIQARVTARTRAVLPVHQFGCPCDMWSLMAIAARHGLAVIEDARRAAGAAWGGRKAGGFGEGCFSFTDADVLTAGEGGMVTTDSAAVADAVRALRTGDYRDCELDVVSACGSRMSDLAAALCRTRLRWLDEDIAARVSSARLLTQGLKDIALLAPPLAPPHATHIYHRYAMRLLPHHPMAPADVTATLRGLGMEVEPSDDTLLKYGAFSACGPELPQGERRGASPAPELSALELAWRLTNRLVFLPMHAGLRAQDIDRTLTTMHLLACQVPKGEHADETAARDGWDPRSLGRPVAGPSNA